MPQLCGRSLCSIESNIERGIDVERNGPMVGRNRGLEPKGVAYKYAIAIPVLVTSAWESGPVGRLTNSRIPP